MLAVNLLANISGLITDPCSWPLTAACGRSILFASSKRPGVCEETGGLLFECMVKLKICKSENKPGVEIPLVQSAVHAGFPSPADDFLEGSLDLNSLVICHPEATFFARVEGDSMKDEGIVEGDILVVDKAVEPYDGCLAVAYVDGEFTLKRVKLEPDRILLIPANPNYQTIEISPENDFAVWGVVRWILKKA